MTNLLKLRCKICLQTFVQQIERESHDLKEEMIFCLLQLVKDKNDADQGRDEYEEWIDLIDREGLFHIKGTIFQFSSPRPSGLRCFKITRKALTFL